jgi:hypothetical protein
VRSNCANLKQFDSLAENVNKSNICNIELEIEKVQQFSDAIEIMYICSIELDIQRVQQFKDANEIMYWSEFFMGMFSLFVLFKCMVS